MMPKYGNDSHGCILEITKHKAGACDTFQFTCVSERKAYRSWRVIPANTEAWQRNSGLPHVDCVMSEFQTGIHTGVYTVAPIEVGSG